MSFENRPMTLHSSDQVHELAAPTWAPAGTTRAGSTWFSFCLPVGSAPPIVNGKALFALRLCHHQLQCFGAKLSTCFCRRTPPLPLKSWRKPVAFTPAHLCRSPGHGRTEQQGGPRQK